MRLDFWCNPSNMVALKNAPQPEEKKFIPLATGETVRLIEAWWNGGITLKEFTAECNKVCGYLLRKPKYKAKVVGKDAELKDLIWGLQRNLSVIECNLDDSQAKSKKQIVREPNIQEVAEAGIMAGLRFMALRIRLDWPNRGHTPVNDLGLRDLIQAEYLQAVKAQTKSRTRIYKVRIVDAAIAKWKTLPGNKNLALPLSRDYLCKHFNDIVGLQSKAKGAGPKSQDQV